MATANVSILLFNGFNMKFWICLKNRVFIVWQYQAATIWLNRKCILLSVTWSFGSILYYFSHLKRIERNMANFLNKCFHNVICYITDLRVTAYSTSFNNYLNLFMYVLFPNPYRKSGLLSHEFFEAGVYYFSDHNFDEAAEYIGTIIVKPKQREHFVELSAEGFDPGQYNTSQSAEVKETSCFMLHFTLYHWKSLGSFSLPACTREGVRPKYFKIYIT